MATWWNYSYYLESQGSNRRFRIKDTKKSCNFFTFSQLKNLSLDASVLGIDHGIFVTQADDNEACKKYQFQQIVFHDKSHRFCTMSSKRLEKAGMREGCWGIGRGRWLLSYRCLGSTNRLVSKRKGLGVWEYKWIQMVMRFKGNDLFSDW